MKKLILIAVLLFTTSQTTFAQQAIAKIKFEEAEEAYAAKNYQITIDKLAEVETILKITNPKVMYLRIMAQYQSIKESNISNYELIYNCKEACFKYLKDYENLPDNDEKYLEVYKVSENKLFDKTVFAQLGLHYFNERDYSKALKYLSLATDMGDIGSISRIGNVYEVQKKYPIALKYYTEAANKGYAKAYEAIAYLYKNGYGVEKNYEQSIKYYRLSAEKGDSTQQFNIGILFLYGEGITKDENEAKIWFQKSADQGNQDAIEALKKLKQ